MKILFLSDNFPPEVNAPANRTFEHCAEWVKKGAKVTVITCAPNFPQGKLYDGYKNKIYQKEILEGIQVIRVWSFISPNKGVITRALDYLSFAVSAFFASLFVKSDIIIATSPQIFTAICGCFVAIVKRKRWIMEVRDLWPESILAVNAINNNKVLQWLEKLELFLYNKAVKIVVVTDAFQERIVERGITAEKVEVVKNGVQMDKFLPMPKDEELLQQLNLKGKFVIGYLGTHGMAHKLDFILECAKETKENVHFLFIGDGAEKKKLLNLQARLGLENVTMIPPIPKVLIRKYISITDLALVPLRKSETFKTVIPSKIFENAAMRKPILLGVEGESECIIKKYCAGICYEPENKVDFLEKLNFIQNNKTFYENCRKGCEKLAINFDRLSLAEKMFHIIQEVIFGKKDSGNVSELVKDNAGFGHN